MKFRIPPALFLALLAIAPLTGVRAQTAALADVETQKCSDKIATVQRDVLGKYDDSLQELQSGFQKAADLESAVALAKGHPGLAFGTEIEVRPVKAVASSLR